MENLRRLLVARTPLIYLVSEGEARVQRLLARLAEKAFHRPVPFYLWSSIQGITHNGQSVSQAPREALEALAWAQGQAGPGLFLFKDLHRDLHERRISRMLKDLYGTFAAAHKTLFLTAPTLSLPEDLADLFTVVDLPLPDAEEMGAILDAVWPTLRKGAPAPELRQAMARAALGLTDTQAERAFRQALATPAPDASIVEAVHRERQQFIRKTGVLEFVDNPIRMEDVGGVEVLKTWMQKRRNIFSPEARDFGLSYPKGVLLMGISGCGKSLFVKAIAGFWRLPLIRLDMARIYDGLLGSPEVSLRKAYRVAEALAPCVLWIDEIEAGISVQGFKAEGGPASRVLGSFLTWMQEKENFVFVAATANAIDLLPPELIRKGRFDEVFFIPLPGPKERSEIFRIHLARRKQDPDAFDLELLGHSTKGFSGAEIEQVVSSALYEAFSEQRPLTQRDLLAAITRTVPLSVTMEEEIKRIEAWAFKRAVRASAKEEA